MSDLSFLKMILKMNFNFNFKDMPPAPRARQSAASQMRVIRITRGNRGLNGFHGAPDLECTCSRTRIKSLAHSARGLGRSEFGKHPMPARKILTPITAAIVAVVLLCLAGIFWFELGRPGAR